MNIVEQPCLKHCPPVFFWQYPAYSGGVVERLKGFSDQGK